MCSQRRAIGGSTDKRLHASGNACPYSSDQVDRHVPQPRLHSANRPSVEPIFVEAHIARPMHAVLNRPVAAHQREQIRRTTAGRRPTRHHRDFLHRPYLARAPSSPAPHPGDLLDPLPAPRCRQIRAEVIRCHDPQFPDLDPPARLLHGLHIRRAPGTHFRPWPCLGSFPARRRNQGFGGWQRRGRLG
jgi:hypothetical protein